MYCVRCGAKASEKRKTCAECGMRLITPEALLKLLKKADSEKKAAAEKKMAVEKAAVIRSDEKKRVMPLSENPVQPRRRSIFDDDIVVEEVKVIKQKPLPKAKKKPEAAAKDNPVVKLPAKKTEDKKMEGRAGRKGYSKDMFLIPERRENAKRSSGIKRSSARSGKGKDTNAVKAKTRVSKKADDEKRHKVKKTPVIRNAKKPAVKKTHSGSKKETFTEKHLRSIVSMCLLFVSVSLFLLWGFTTEKGLKSFARYGIGTSRGYILLGDDCMESGNFTRAVEYYYRALRDKTDYTAAKKLSEAYRQTGDTERESSALLLLMDNYPQEDWPYQRILQLYPDPKTRPESVKNAISMHESKR